jgi:molecular chaperone IbpA
MNLRNFPVSPFFSDAILSDRFNRMDRLFSQLTGDASAASIPAYDLQQLDGEHYALTVSVPGWTQSELEIEVTGGQLTVAGRKADNNKADADAEKEAGPSWLHRGIHQADFRLSFTVPELVKVTGARLENGLLRVALEQEVPESAKPRRIPIEQGDAQLLSHQA